MIRRLLGAVFAPKYPRYYTGRHRAPGTLWSVPRQRREGTEVNSAVNPPA